MTGYKILSWMVIIAAVVWPIVFVAVIVLAVRFHRLKKSVKKHMEGTVVFTRKVDKTVETILDLFATYIEQDQPKKLNIYFCSYTSFEDYFNDNHKGDPVPQFPFDDTFVFLEVREGKFNGKEKEFIMDFIENVELTGETKNE
jgi:hypothetical protein